MLHLIFLLKASNAFNHLSEGDNDGSGRGKASKHRLGQKITEYSAEAKNAERQQHKPADKGNQDHGTDIVRQLPLLLSRRVAQDNRVHRSNYGDETAVWTRATSRMR
jgi:hypothetical protein